MKPLLKPLSRAEKEGPSKRTDTRSNAGHVHGERRRPTLHDPRLVRGERHPLAEEREPLLRGPVDRPEVHDDRAVLFEVHLLLERGAQEEHTALVEEAFGRTPPYGVLVYGDGREFRVVWNAAARAEVLAGLVRLGGLYTGEAEPAPWKCRRCRFQGICPAVQEVRG